MNGRDERYNNNTVQIARMTAETAERVAELERICFPDPWSLYSLRSELGNPSAVYFTALSGGAVAGYVGFHQVLDEIQVTNVAVAPDWRRRGIARALITQVMDFAVAGGMSVVMLEVRESNEAAIALYTDFGFERVGRRRGYYRSPTEDALLMSRRL